MCVHVEPVVTQALLASFSGDFELIFEVTIGPLVAEHTRKLIRKWLVAQTTVSQDIVGSEVCECEERPCPRYDASRHFTAKCCEQPFSIPPF